MSADPHAQQMLYAELLVKIGVNLQPGQSLRVGSELAHCQLARLVNAAAYQAGARYVQMDWIDAPTAYNRLVYSSPAALEYFPEYEVQRHRQMVDEGWARLSLVGSEFPDIFDDIDPSVMRRTAQIRAQRLKFYSEAIMANQSQWCVAAVPTPAWAAKVFPALPSDQGVTQLWQAIYGLCRVDQPDPVAAWRNHDEKLRQVTNYMRRQQVRTIHLYDASRQAGELPATDLTVGLTDRPVWVAASSVTPAGVRFLPNIPTEEVFTTPHNQRVNGWVRTSKPAFPLEREVSEAWFRFEQGELVEFRAAKGQAVLDEFFQIAGARRLGEISLVDVRSPINQSGLLFHETLFDENAVCHLAFGRAYPEGLEGAAELSEAELAAQGVNQSDTHVDFMIGTPTMQVDGLCADGRQVALMRDGQFVPELFQSQEL